MNGTEGEGPIGSFERPNGVIAWSLGNGLTYSGVEEIDVPEMGTISTLKYRGLGNEVYNITYNIVVIDDVVLNIRFDRTWGSNLSCATLTDTNIPAVEAMFE